MSYIVTISDFETGAVQLAFNTYQETTIEAFIASTELSTLVRCLGKELADLFIADLNGYDPQTARFTALMTQQTVQVGKRIYVTNGLREICKGFIKAEYLRELQSRQTTVGRTKAKADNSDVQTVGYLTGWNETVTDYRGLQAYIRQNRSVYPEFAGVQIDMVSPLW